MVHNARLLTLTGAGGSGKTRLALEAARGMVKEFGDGVFLVELAALSEARLIQPALASALGLHEQPGRPLAATISDYLCDRQLLIVLDNCEHLAADVASLVATFLQRSPALHVLATSRVQLGVAGERTWNVPELAESEAVALFTARASEAHDGFALTKQTETQVAGLCRRLDGMPLAIELAAARLKTLSLDQLIARLTDRFALLRSTGRTLLPRQQTLAATMDWSHELLPERAQRLWRRLSVFAGGFTLEAAEAICSGEHLDQADILEELTILVENSLVQVTDRNGHHRYHMLETIREYARLKLEQAGESDRLHRRHLQWFLELAQRAEPEWRGRSQSEWLDRLDRDVDNLRAALLYCQSQPNRVDQGLALASAAWLLWLVRDHIGESRQWFATLLERSHPGPARAYGLNVAGFVAYVQGDTAAALPLLQQSLVLNQTLGNEAGANFALLRLGIGLYYDNNLDRAVETLDRALSRYRDAADRVGIYIASYELAEALTMRGDFDRARTLHDESLALKQQQGDEWHIAFSYFGLGLLAWRKADQHQAIRWLHQCIVLRRELSETWGLNRAVEALAWVLATRGDALRATHLLGASAAMLERSSTALSPNYRVHHDACVTASRAVLGHTAFDKAWSQGHDLSVDQALKYALQGGPLPAATRPRGAVSRREEEIANLVATGLTNRQIAERLHLAERTVDAHVEHIMNKLGYRSRAQIAAWSASRTTN